MADKFDVTTFHRTAIVSHLEQYAKSAEQSGISQEEREKYTHQIWLDYARLERPKRLCRILLFLIERAARSERLTYYKEIQEVAGTDSYHEVMHLIKLLGEVCRENDWPPYPVLIKQESSQKVGSGFFTDYGQPNDQRERDRYEAGCEIECKTRVPPTMVEVSTRLIEFIDKKGLGKI